jgi:hypothetical protein
MLARGHIIHYPQNLLALPSTCRQIHAESRLFPFHSNVFFGHARDFKAAFGALHHKVQLEAVTSLCFPPGPLIDTNYTDCEHLTGLRRVGLAIEGWAMVCRRRGLKGQQRFIDDSIAEFEAYFGTKNLDVQVVPVIDFFQIDTYHEFMGTRLSRMS